MHCFHRVSPTEKRGRTHTSTIAVSVIDSQSFRRSTVNIDPNDVTIQYTRAQGNGGQKVNKTNSCVIITHIPTGTQFKVQDDRHRSKNEEIAWSRLKQKLEDDVNRGTQQNLRNSRYNPNNARNNKRTYKVKDGFVVDHVTGKRAELRQIYRGNIDLLHE